MVREPGRRSAREDTAVVLEVTDAMKRKSLRSRAKLLPKRDLGTGYRTGKYPGRG